MAPTNKSVYFTALNLSLFWSEHSVSLHNDSDSSSCCVAVFLPVGVVKGLLWRSARQEASFRVSRAGLMSGLQL